MRFAARMVAAPGAVMLQADDVKRRFTLALNTADSAISIYEPKDAANRDGLPGGKYLDRTVVKKPAQQGGGSYGAEDMGIGAVLYIYGRAFELTAASDKTLEYMEARPDKFPAADADAVVAKLGGALAAEPELVETFTQALLKSSPSGQLTPTGLCGAAQACGLVLSKQEGVTLVRKAATHSTDMAMMASSSPSSEPTATLEALAALVGLSGVSLPPLAAPPAPTGHVNEWCGALKPRDMNRTSMALPSQEQLKVMMKMAPWTSTYNKSFTLQPSFEAEYAKAMAATQGNTAPLAPPQPPAKRVNFMDHFAR